MFKNKCKIFQEMPLKQIHISTHIQSNPNILRFETPKLSRKFNTNCHFHIAESKSSSVTEAAYAQAKQ